MKTDQGGHTFGDRFSNTVGSYLLNCRRHVKWAQGFFARYKMGLGRTKKARGKILRAETSRLMEAKTQTSLVSAFGRARLYRASVNRICLKRSIWVTFEKDSKRATSHYRSCDERQRYWSMKSMIKWLWDDEGVSTPLLKLEVSIYHENPS